MAGLTKFAYLIFLRLLDHIGTEMPHTDCKAPTTATIFGLLILAVTLAPSLEAQESSKNSKKLRKLKENARSLSLAFRDAAELALPTTVKILCKTKTDNEEGNSILDILPGGEDSQRFDSVGSGVIVSSDGLILTNHHVIKDASRIEVQLTDGRDFTVEKTKSDPGSDVAIIQLDLDEELPVAELGESEGLHVGDWVLAIGSPFMLDQSVSAGIISSTSRFRQLSETVRGQFLQTDAAINPGNSGGPLVDLDGKVVGINTAISSRSGGFQGIGFAIPISRASWIMQELLEYDKVRRAYIGVGTADIPYQVAKELGLPTTGGVMVKRITANRPGKRAGLMSGDVILKFDGYEVPSASDFFEIVQRSPIGEDVPIVILREGKQLDLTIVPIERPFSR